MAATIPSPLVFVGTYTNGRKKGVYCYRFGSETGALEFVDSFDVGPNPSFLALHPTGRFLYAVNEVDELAGQPGGGVTACAYHPSTGHLRVLNTQSSVGTGPCHVVVEPGGRYALAANYMGGSVCVLPIVADGSLEPASELVQHVGSGPDPARQGEPHAHSVTVTPDGSLALVADLGLDKIMVYRLDVEAGRLHPAAPQSTVALNPAAGPRHLAFHPNGHWLYVINELDSTLSTFAYEAGSFACLNTISTLPADFAGTSHCADVHVSPDGRFVYGSNRGHDSILVAAIGADGLADPCRLCAHRRPHAAQFRPLT